MLYLNASATSVRDIVTVSVTTEIYQEEKIQQGVCLKDSNNLFFTSTGEINLNKNYQDS